MGVSCISIVSFSSLTVGKGHHSELLRYQPCYWSSWGRCLWTEVKGRLQRRGWRDGSEAENTYCSSRRAQLGSYHPQRAAHNCMLSQFPRTRHLHPCLHTPTQTYTDTCTSVHTDTYIHKNKSLKLKTLQERKYWCRPSPKAEIGCMPSATLQEECWHSPQPGHKMLPATSNHEQELWLYMQTFT